jgi:hypothetical protein
MPYIVAIWTVAILALLGASRAHAGTPTLDFSLDEFAGLIGEPAEGTARIVLTGVDEQGRVTAESALGKLQSFDSRGMLARELIDTLGGGMPIINLQLEPGSGPFDGESFLFEMSSLPGTVPLALTITLGDLEVPSGARAFFFLFARNGAGLLQATGREIGRSFSSLPEPFETSTLLLGLTALAIREIRRRSASR